MAWRIGVGRQAVSSPPADAGSLRRPTGLAPAPVEVEPAPSDRRHRNELHHSADASDAFSLFSLSGKGETQCRAQVVADVECYHGLCVVLSMDPKRSTEGRAGEEIKTMRCFWYIPFAVVLSLGCIASH